MRLGFAVKVLGRIDLPSHDTRRWQSDPHLRVSLQYLAAVFDYLAETDITMYRISSDLAPYLTHPAMPQFHRQIEECAPELAELGARARTQGLRLSFHPAQFIVLNSPDEAIVSKSVADLVAQAELLDRMGQGRAAVVVTHVGGTYGDVARGRARWVQTYEQLPEQVRRRLVLEHDDTRYDVADILWIHERTGVPLVFDYLHHCCNNRDAMDIYDALVACLRTWPVGVTPKIHFSSPRTEQPPQKQRTTATTKAVSIQSPNWRAHADYINPFEFITFMRGATGMPDFDVMLECKLKDVALLQLREDLKRYAPSLSCR